MSVAQTEVFVYGTENMMGSQSYDIRATVQPFILSREETNAGMRGSSTSFGGTYDGVESEVMAHSQRYPNEQLLPRPEMSTSAVFRHGSYVKN